MRIGSLSSGGVQSLGRVVVMIALEVGESRQVGVAIAEVEVRV